MPIDWCLLYYGNNNIKIDVKWGIHTRYQNPSSKFCSPKNEWEDVARMKCMYSRSKPSVSIFYRVSGSILKIIKNKLINYQEL